MSTEQVGVCSIPLQTSAGDVWHRELSYREALREALAQALELDGRVFLLGEGIDDPTGVYGTTVGLADRFGRGRVMDLPIAENGMTGVAVGAALAGMLPVFIHMRADFLPMAMDQLVNHAAKWRYMTGGRCRVPLTIRAVVARGWGSAAQHAQSLQGLFAHVPGLRVLMPATPSDAKGMLLDSIFSDCPTVFLEHRWLYDHREPVQEDAYRVPPGTAQIRRVGTDLTLAGVSLMVPELLKVASLLEERGVSAEVLDMRSLQPLDETALLTSVRKTGRLLVADTDWVFCGFSAEVAALVAEKAFHSLRGPVRRIGLPQVPAPSSSSLEAAYYPSLQDILRAASEIL